jgi:hypothetical protein
VRKQLPLQIAFFLMWALPAVGFSQGFQTVSNSSRVNNQGTVLIRGGGPMNPPPPPGITNQNITQTGGFADAVGLDQIFVTRGNSSASMTFSARALGLIGQSTSSAYFLGENSQAGVVARTPQGGNPRSFATNTHTFRITGPENEFYLFTGFADINYDRTRGPVPNTFGSVAGPGIVANVSSVAGINATYADRGSGVNRQITSGPRLGGQGITFSFNVLVRVGDELTYTTTADANELGLPAAAPPFNSTFARVTATVGGGLERVDPATLPSGPISFNWFR